MTDQPRIRRALLSVTDKTHIADLARRLAALGTEIISTGGTAKAIEAAGVPVTRLGDYTGSPEMLDGRVKTLHPKVHGGILARRDLDSHVAQVESHGIGYIDLVAVNLYDFSGAVARGADFEATVEEIDIGGPTLLRAAAKNHAQVVVLTKPDDYAPILDRLEAGEDIDASTRRRLARDVYTHTARYDAEVAAYFERQVSDGPVEAPAQITKSYERVLELRYGENPHQAAAFYRPVGEAPSFFSATETLQGKALSFNNLLDADSALGLAIDLGAVQSDPVAVFIKHNNPCGAACAKDVPAAIRTARDCDALSAFGSVVAVNRPLDEAAAAALTESFVEAIIAPGYDEAALAVLAKKKNLRVLKLDEASWAVAKRPEVDLRLVRGGALLQTKDSGSRIVTEIAEAKVVTERAPTEAELAGLAFTWVAAKHVRSNAIVFGQADRLVGVGAGQMSRVDAVKICGLKAGEALKGTVVASDAFFPFRDGVDVLAEAGATAIAQPGGSKRDEEVIAAANEHGIAMVFTGVRHFRH
ncbi:MAG: bifunctional phosphoribosylaminoimidazolecarboxamide formyltransferase/IMP cyclohydrolase [Deltaproteobacteria bacterium]